MRGQLGECSLASTGWIERRAGLIDNRSEMNDLQRFGLVPHSSRRVMHHSLRGTAPERADMRRGTPGAVTRVALVLFTLPYFT